MVKKLHQKVKDNLEKRTEAYKRQGDKGRKHVVFKPGEWVWVHMRPERFPQKRSSKLMPKGDGPFKVLERIKDNAYKLELPGDMNISSSFNVADLSLYEDDSAALRTKLSQEGENDEDMNARPAAARELTIPTPKGPITRSRAKEVREGFTKAVGMLMSSIQEETLDEALSISTNIDLPLLGAYKEVLIFTFEPEPDRNH